MRYYLILGVSDAVTAYTYSRRPGVDYLWVSSFVTSAMLGLNDDGMINLETYSPLLRAITRASRKPVILDFDVGGNKFSQYRNNLYLLKRLGVGGVCIEDERWPKMNAMIKNPHRRLISPSYMAKKIRIAKNILGRNVLVIARTHSFIVRESLHLLQKRVNSYQTAGADILCIHYVGRAWQFYQEILDRLQITKPLLLILSKKNAIPEQLLLKSPFQFLLYPNQLYRVMLHSIFQSFRETNFIKTGFSLKKDKMVRVNTILGIMNKINA